MMPRAASISARMAGMSARVAGRMRREAFGVMSAVAVEDFRDVADGTVGVAAEGGEAERTAGDDRRGIGDREVVQGVLRHRAALLETERDAAQRAAAADAFGVALARLDDFACGGERSARLLVDAAAAAQFARVVPDEFLFLVARRTEPSFGDQLLEEDAVVHHADAFQGVFLLENAVADRAGEQQRVAAAGADDLQVLVDQLARLLRAAGHHQRPAAAESFLVIHQLPAHAGLVQQGRGRAPDGRRQPGHAPGEIEHAARAGDGRSHRLHVDAGIRRREGVFAPLALRHAQLRPLRAHLADGRAFAAQQAFVRDLLDAPLVAAAQLAVEVDRRILAVDLAHAHRAGVDADAAARAGIDFQQGETLARMADADPGVAHRDQQHLRGDVHVAGERQHAHEDAQRDRIGPPGRQGVEVVAQELAENPVHRDRQETAAADVRRETLGEQAQREDGPEGIESHPVQQAQARGAPHAHDARGEALDDRERDAAEYQQQEEVHQEHQQGALQGRFRLRHEEVEEDRVVEETDAVRQEEHHLQVPQHDQHEPAEGDAGMHIAQDLVALPQLDVDQAVEEDVPDVHPDVFRGDERQQEALAVRPRQLRDHADHRHEAVAQHEEHPEQERDDEGVESVRETFPHRTTSPLRSNRQSVRMRCRVLIPRGQTIVHLPQSMQRDSIRSTSSSRPRCRPRMTLRTLIPDQGAAVQVALQLPQPMHVSASGSSCTSRS